MAKPNMFGVTEFDQDPETAAELMRLKRQQQIADAMYGQSQQPLQGGMAGQVYVPPSITQGLAKLFQGYSAGRQSADVQEGYKGLATDRRAMEDSERARVMEALVGRPEQPMGPPTPTGEMGVREAAPAGTKEQVMQALASSRLPAYRDAGLKGMIAERTAKADRTVVPAGASVFEGGKAVYTAPFKPSYENASNLSKLIAERADIAKANPADPALKAYDNAIRKESEIAKQIVPPTLTGNIEKPMTAAQKLKFEQGIGNDFKSTGQVMQSMAQINTAINDVMSSPGLSAREGYTGYLPAWSQGPEAMKAQNRIETLKGKVTQMGKAMASMSGAIGPMAVQEWKIVADAVNALDPTAGNFKEQLSNVQAQAEGASARIKDWYDRRYMADFEKYPQFKTESIPLYPTGGGGQSAAGKIKGKPDVRSEADKILGL